MTFLDDTVVPPKSNCRPISRRNWPLVTVEPRAAATILPAEPMVVALDRASITRDVVVAMAIAAEMAAIAVISVFFIYVLLLLSGYDAL